MLQSVDSNASLLRLIEETPNNGLLRYLWVFNKERLIITSPRAIREVIVAKSYVFAKPLEVRQFLGRVAGHGVLLSEGDEHKVQRRNLMPAFTFRHVKNLYPIFWDKSMLLVQAISDTCDSDNTAQIDIHAWVSRCTLDTIGLAVLGLDFRAIQDEHNELNQRYTQLMTPCRQDKIMLALATFLPSRVLHRLPLSRNTVIAKSVKHLRNACGELLAARRQRGTGCENTDIVSVALSSGQFSDTQLVDQMMTFLSAGHDTSTAAFTWAVYALAAHPDIQERLRGELGAHLPAISGQGGSVSSSEIDRLPYLHAVCSEVFRLYAPLPQNVRDALHDTTIEGIRVPRGTRIILAPWATNVDGELWGRDAKEFRPDRWLSTDHGGMYDVKTASSGGATSNYAFLSFSHGPRSCIGQSFARGELACFLAAWVGRFRFELADKALVDWSKVRLEPAVAARPLGGLQLKGNATGAQRPRLNFGRSGPVKFSQRKHKVGFFVHHRALLSFLHKRDSHRAGWTSDRESNARAIRHLNAICRGAQDANHAACGAHADAEWISTDISDGLFLSDRSVLDMTGSELVTLPAIMCQDLKDRLTGIGKDA
ncbi:hypothetical protein QQS21_000892 [Conoideocrella luteorostrata]|uniref:Cytochrome P450 n=1 Tax=Conoideocrella luteorostrata TaxID=1105319 RepID=A0AAJ0D0M4_9HYPO|nr:hypothetical protein QQS21_000892 [Conoideocrella luteorostrata]